MDYKAVIDKIYTDLQEMRGEGKVADYIPALAKTPSQELWYSSHNSLR